MNEQSFVTLQHWGIIGTDARAVQSYYSGDWSPGSYVTFDSIPLLELPLYSDVVPGANPYYLSYIPETEIMRPSNAYRNVVKVTAGKAANSNLTYINFKDANDNIVFSTQTDPNLVVVYDGPITNHHISPLTLGIAVADQGGGNYAGVITIFSNISGYEETIHPSLKAFNYGITWNYSYDVDDWLQGQLDGKYYTGVPGGPGGSAGPDGEASGGGGLYNMPDFDIPYSSLPTLSAVDSGFVSLYKMSTAQLQALANDLWDANFFNSLAKHFSDPFDNIISLGIVPFGVTGTLSPIVIADYTCPTSGDKLSSEFYEIDCGIIYMKHYFEHFGDYQIKFDLYLPYCGTVSIDPSEIMGGSIGVKYLFSVFSGACIAEVKCYSGTSSHVLYNKEGNIRTELPISGRDYAEYYKGLISSIGIMTGAAAVGIVGAGVATTGLGIAKAAGVGVAGVGSSIMQQTFNKPAYQRSGNISGPAGYMGIQYPYLIASIPNYFGGPAIGEECGYVSNLPCLIGDQEGYLQSEVDFEILSGINCTQREQQMIKDALAEGIYI